LRLLLKLLLLFATILSQHWFLSKTPFFRQNWRKLQKVVVITSTPDFSGLFGGVHTYKVTFTYVHTYFLNSRFELNPGLPDGLFSNQKFLYGEIFV
jgi:hypothetical protein